MRERLPKREMTIKLIITDLLMNNVSIRVGVLQVVKPDTNRIGYSNYICCKILIC